jgi:putative transposase
MTRPEFRNDADWHNRGYLPHYDVSHKYQMITYRLADSLPLDLINKIQNSLPGIAGGSPANRNGYTEDQVKKRKLIEKYLDHGYGACYLKNPKIAQVVANNWKHFDNKRYDLIAYVIMPNHVHLLIKTYQGHALKDVVHSWKSYTGHKIKKILTEAQAGEPPAIPAKVWMEDYWDRFIRDEKHFHTSIKYILENPLKATLVKQIDQWPWIYLSKS